MGHCGAILLCRSTNWRVVVHHQIGNAGTQHRGSQCSNLLSGKHHQLLSGTFLFHLANEVLPPGKAYGLGICSGHHTLPNRNSDERQRHDCR